jgi:molecular chaperone HscA
MEAMLLDSLSNAKEDMQARALVEARTEAQQMLDTVSRFLQKNGSLLQEEEHKTTQKQMNMLKEALESKDKNLIQTETEKLNEITRPYAERLMDAALTEAMKGKKIL